MKIKEAKEIVGYILEWQFVCMGVKERNEISKTLDLKKYSLNDLITANKLVDSNNRRKRKLAETLREKGLKVRGVSISLILADRLIAAVYTAMSFSPDGEMIALIDDVGVGCVQADYA